MLKIARQIVREIASGTVGCTFKLNGEKAQMSSGYLVGVGGSILPFSTDEQKITEQTSQIYSLYNCTYIGFWIRDNQVYLDAVRWFSNKQHAIRMAKRKNQLAIYDCKNQQDLEILK